MIIINSQLLYTAKDYPNGYEGYRDKVRKAYKDNKHIDDQIQIKKLIRQSEFAVKELQALYKLMKYRAMKSRYYTDADNKGYIK